MSPARRPIGASSRQRDRAAALSDLPTTKPIELPRNSPDRLCRRLLRGRHRLRADLAYLVDGGRRAARRVRDLRGVRLARSRRIRTSGRRRWRRPTMSGGRRASRWSKAARPGLRRLSMRPHTSTIPTSLAAMPSPTAASRGRPRSASSPATASGSSCCPTSSCSPASTPPMRCFRTRPPAARRPAELFDLQDRRDRDGLPAAVELRLRHGDDRQPMRATCSGRRSAIWSPARWGCGFLGAGNQRVRADARGGRGARPQRVPFGVLRAGRLPRPARDDRAAVARAR